MFCCSCAIPKNSVTEFAHESPRTSFFGMRASSRQVDKIYAGELLNAFSQDAHFFVRDLLFYSLQPYEGYSSVGQQSLPNSDKIVSG